MARIFTAGFETDIAHLERNAGATSIGMASGRVGGYALPITDATGNHVWTQNLTVDKGPTTYHRLYVKVCRRPTSSKTSFWNLYGTAQASRNPIVPQITASITSTGKIAFDSLVPDDTPAVVNIITGVVALTANTWYRLNIQASTQSNIILGTHKRNDLISYVIYALDGSVVETGTGATNSTTVETGASALTHGFSVGTDTSTFKTGGEIHLDDWVVDDALMPGPGFVALLRPRAAGTYQEWTTNDFKQARTVPYANNTVLTSAGASKRLSYVMQSFASKGMLAPPSGAIKSLRISAGDAFTTGRASWNYGIIVNGAAAVYDTAHAASSGNGGWLIDAATINVRATDVIEAVLRDGSGAGTNATTQFLGVIVDYEGPDYVIENGYVDAIQMYEGTFTGNGTIQEITVPFTRTAQPDFIYVRPSTAAGAGGWWHRGMGEFGDFAQTIAGTTVNSPICGVGANAFTVRQNGGVNTNLVTNKFFAISDPRQRLFRHGKVAGSFDSAVDNRNVAIDNLLFVVESLIVWDEGNTSAGQATSLLDTTNNTDAASIVSSALATAADFIQSIGTGTFQLGTKSQVSGSAGVDYAAFRRTGTFTQQALFDYGSYVGDGALSKVVTINLSTAQAPGLLIVIPESNNGRGVRFGSGGNFGFVDGLVYTTSGITALNRTSFTVAHNGTPDLNVNGVRYHYLAFGVGTDKAPCLLRATATEYEWADPVSPARPQVTPGSSTGLGAPEFTWT